MTTTGEISINDLQGIVVLNENNYVENVYYTLYGVLKQLSINTGEVVLLPPHVTQISANLTIFEESTKGLDYIDVLKGTMIKNVGSEYAYVVFSGSQGAMKVAIASRTVYTMTVNGRVSTNSALSLWNVAYGETPAWDGGYVMPVKPEPEVYPVVEVDMTPTTPTNEGLYDTVDFTDFEINMDAIGNVNLPVPLDEDGNVIQMTPDEWNAYTVEQLALLNNDEETPITTDSGGMGAIFGIGALIVIVLSQ